jgi:hypothetical protein
MTRVLHELTMFVPGLDWFDPQPDDRLVHTFTSNDPDHLPRFYKQYGDDLPRVRLAATMPPLPAASGVLAGTATVRGRPVGLVAAAVLVGRYHPGDAAAGRARLPDARRWFGRRPVPARALSDGAAGRAR